MDLTWTKVPETKVPENNTLDRLLEFWSFVGLGLKETAHIRYGNPDVVVSRFNYQDAVFYSEYFRN